MDTTINNAVQNQVWPKEIAQSDSTKKQSKTEKAQDGDSAVAKEKKDAVEIQNASRRSTESTQNSKEITNPEEVQKSVEEVVGLIQSENGNINSDQVHDLNPGSVIDILV